MKILVVNLLRIGDVIMAAPAISALRTARGSRENIEIDLLVNKTVRQVGDILPGIRRVYLFDRDRIQKGLVEAKQRFFEPYHVVEDLIHELSLENYDFIYNFSHNRLSGWLVGLIPATKKIGLVLDESGRASFGSAWIKQLNTQIELEPEHGFHHTDVFFGAAGGIHAQRERRFQDVRLFDNLLLESKCGSEKAAKIILDSGYDESSSGKLIAVQVSTSDPQKEWGDARHARLIQRIINENRDHRILLLGAPFEAERIRNLHEMIGNHAQVRGAVVDLATVVSLFEYCDLVVTGDTSIKHIGSASTAPVFEISTGPVEPYRTGPWKQGDISVMTSKERQDGTDEAEIISLVIAYLKGDSEFQRCAEKSQEVVILQVDRTEGVAQFFRLDRAYRTHGISDREVSTSIEKSARRLLLEARDGRLDRMTLGSEIRLTLESLKKKYSDIEIVDLRHMIGGGQSVLRHASGLLHSLNLQLDKAKESIQDERQYSHIIASIVALSGRLRVNPWTSYVVEPLLSIAESDRTTPFVRYRRLVDATQEFANRVEMELKLIDGIEIEILNHNLKELR